MRLTASLDKKLDNQMIRTEILDLGSMQYIGQGRKFQLLSGKIKKKIIFEFFPKKKLK